MPPKVGSGLLSKAKSGTHSPTSSIDLQQFRANAKAKSGEAAKHDVPKAGHALSRKNSVTTLGESSPAGSPAPKAPAVRRPSTSKAPVLIQSSSKFLAPTKVVQAATATGQSKAQAKHATPHHDNKSAKPIQSSSSQKMTELQEELIELREENVRLRTENVNLTRKVASTDSLVSKVSLLMDRFQLQENEQATRLATFEELAAESFYQEEAHQSELIVAHQDKELALQAMSKARAQLADKHRIVEEISDLTEHGIVESQESLNRALLEAAAHQQEAVAGHAECESLRLECEFLRSECAVRSEQIEEVPEDQQPPSPSILRWSRLAVLVRFNVFGEIIHQAVAASSQRVRTLVSSQAATNISAAKISDEIVAAARLDVEEAKASMKVALTEIQQEQSTASQKQADAAKSSLQVEQIQLRNQALEECEAKQEEQIQIRNQALEESEAKSSWQEEQIQRRSDALAEFQTREQHAKSEILTYRMQVGALKIQLAKSTDRKGVATLKKIDQMPPEEAQAALRQSCQHLETVVKQEEAAFTHAEKVASAAVKQNQEEVANAISELERARDLESEQAAQLRKLRKDPANRINADVEARIPDVLAELQSARNYSTTAMHEWEDECEKFERNASSLHNSLFFRSKEIKELREEVCQEKSLKDELQEALAASLMSDVVGFKSFSIPDLPRRSSLESINSSTSKDDVQVQEELAFERAQVQELEVNLCSVRMALSDAEHARDFLEDSNAVASELSSVKEELALSTDSLQKATAEMEEMHQGLPAKLVKKGTRRSTKARKPRRQVTTASTGVDSTDSIAFGAAPSEAFSAAASEWWSDPAVAEMNCRRTSSTPSSQDSLSQQSATSESDGDILQEHRHRLPKSYRELAELHLHAQKGSAMLQTEVIALRSALQKRIEDNASLDEVSEAAEKKLLRNTADININVELQSHLREKSRWEEEVRELRTELDMATGSGYAATSSATLTAQAAALQSASNFHVEASGLREQLMSLMNDATPILELRSEVDTLASSLKQSETTCEEEEVAAKEAICWSSRPVSSSELAFARSEMQLWRRREEEEAKEFLSEAAHCRALEVEMATALADHAAALCDAKLSAVRAAAHHDEESERLRLIASHQEHFTHELSVARTSQEQEALALQEEWEGWEQEALALQEEWEGWRMAHARQEEHQEEWEGWQMARMRQEEQGQMLQELVASHGSEIVELHARLHLARQEEEQHEEQFLMEAELAADSYTEMLKQRLSVQTDSYTEIQQSEIVAPDHDQCDAVAAVLPAVHASSSQPSGSLQDVGYLKSLISQEVQEAEAAEHSARKEFEELQMLSSTAEEDHAVSTPYFGSSAQIDEIGILIMEDQSEAVENEIAKLMADIHGLHQDSQSPLGNASSDWWRTATEGLHSGSEEVMRLAEELRHHASRGFAEMAEAQDETKEGKEYFRERCEQLEVELARTREEEALQLRALHGEGEQRESAALAEHAGLEEELSRSKVCLDLALAKATETEALCRAELRAEAASWRESINEVDANMRALQQQTTELVHVSMREPWEARSDNEVKSLNDSEAPEGHVAHTAQAITAGMRAQVTALFEELDSQAAECKSMEELVAAERSNSKYMRRELEQAIASHQFAELPTDMSELSSQFSAHPGTAGHAAWRNLESMMEDDKPVTFDDAEALISDFEQRFAHVHLGVQSLMESSFHPALSQLASQCEALHKSVDLLRGSLPNAGLLAARNEQFQRSKHALLSVLPRMAKLTAQVDELRESRDSLIKDHSQQHAEVEVTQVALTEEQELCTSLELRLACGFEAEAELRRAQSEMEALEQVAGLHAQHSLKVHRLMCEDAQHRILSTKRGAIAHASPQRPPGARRSSALRAWQSSIETQSQALLERSWDLLNTSDLIHPSSQVGLSCNAADHTAEVDGLARPNALISPDSDQVMSSIGPPVKEYWIGS